MEEVILVDENDIPIGFEEKIKAHKDAKLHRAFSVFVFNENNEFLIHKRASGKYHCGGLWSNTCCSHPRPDEKLIDAAHRRLQEEMGFDCELEHSFSTIYKLPFDNGLTEHEFDHVFIGKSSKEPVINTDEVEEWKYISHEYLIKDLETSKDKYTPWFKLLVPKLKIK